MKVNLTIEAVNQEEIKALFAALAGLDVPTMLCTGKVVATPGPVKTAIAKPETATTTVESSTTDKTEDATPTEPVEPTAEKLTPAELKKREISAEIVELGGTPPEKGAVKKFQEALDALKAESEVKDEDGVEDGPEDNVDDITADDTATEEDEDDKISLDDVRTLAHAVVKSTPEDPALGRSKLGACLKQVHAESLTKATQQQLKQVVPLLENNIGKTMAEVLAESE